ncbi:MAG: hypothetical protein L0219_22155 [Phycisphaerales bacterium]|nr:hypothetical protein [Phycisphaerales bacterium]
MALDRPQVLDQVALLLLGQAQLEEAIVVIDDVVQGGEAAIVVEAAFVELVGVEEGTQGSGDVAVARSAIGLEVVDADFVGGVDVVAGLAEQRRDVAGTRPAQSESNQDSPGASGD